MSLTKVSPKRFAGHLTYITGRKVSSTMRMSNSLSNPSWHVYQSLQPRTERYLRYLSERSEMKNDPLAQPSIFLGSLKRSSGGNSDHDPRTRSPFTTYPRTSSRLISFSIYDSSIASHSLPHLDYFLINNDA